MKIIILGAGQVGRTAAQALAREEANEVTVVDIDDEALRELKDRADVRTVFGNAANPNTLEAAGWKAVPTGIEHGTITVVIGGAPVEVTTLRQDVETFGRKAKVMFGRDWIADAQRRDFTFNALSASADGTVYDYVGGLSGGDRTEKMPRRDPNDGARDVGEVNCLANRRQLLVKTLHPISITDDRYCRTAGCIVLCPKCPAHQSVDT